MYGDVKNDWKVSEDFNELISNLSVSSFQLIADSLDSLKDLKEFISTDRSGLGSHSKLEVSIKIYLFYLVLVHSKMDLFLSRYLKDLPVKKNF